MPPAFNLSQDQTLQFNLCKLSSKLTWKNQFHVSIRVFLFARHHITYAMQRRPPTPNAHTYRLLIFKEQAATPLVRLDLTLIGRLCLSSRRCVSSEEMELWACRIGLSNAFDEIFATGSPKRHTSPPEIHPSLAPEAILRVIASNM